MLGVFIEFPWAAFVIAALFVFGWWRSRRATEMLLAAICWTAYGGYETMMQLRWCTGECNIRVDLLLFYPILAIVSLFALWRYFRA